jgi:hypothetical protein
MDPDSDPDPGFGSGSRNKKIKRKRREEREVDIVAVLADAERSHLLKKTKNAVFFAIQTPYKEVHLGVPLLGQVKIVVHVVVGY